MDHLSLFLADRNQLFREGLKRLLAEKQLAVIGEAASLAEADLAHAGDRDLDLLMLDCEGCDTSLYPALLAEIRRHCPQIKIVVLTADRTREALMKAIEWPVDGYLLKDMSADTLVRSLQLIMLGQQTFPTSLMMSLMRTGPAEPPAPERLSAARGLSPRELQILQSLVDGQSNKAMARRLAISEATIKVHLKSLLRKVRAKNRTQAAVWALSNGLHRESDRA